MSRAVCFIGSIVVLIAAGAALLSAVAGELPYFIPFALACLSAWLLNHCEKG